MKSIESFVIRLPKKFKDEIELNGNKLFLDSKFDEFGNRFMEAEIVSTPLRYDTGAKAGDTLYFHHHVVLSPQYSMGDHIYLVPYHPQGNRNNMANAYKNEDGIHMLGQWVFLDPMDSSKKLKSSLLELVQEDVDNDRGRVLYSSPEIKEVGVEIGEVVYFSKNSDYEMEVDGKKVWRMLVSDLMYVAPAEKE